MAAPAFVSATLVGTVAGTSFSGSHTASAGDREVLICAAQRGTSGTNPTALTYGGVDVLTAGTPVTPLCQTASGQRAHRWYHLPRALHPGAGSRAVTCSWAGVDNIAVAVIEVSADGTVSFPSNNQNSAGGTVSITALIDELTIGCAQGNSATPAFAPVNGQTEYLESVWFASSGHVIGVQTGAQSAASWTGAGSICASAFVMRNTVASHSLGFDAIMTGAPALTQLTLGQTHILGLTALATPAPTLSALTLGQVHLLGLSALATQAPALSQLTLGQVHALGLGALSTPSPFLSSLALGQTHVLGFNALATPAPQISQLSLTGSSSLEFNPITTGEPALSQLAFGQTHQLGLGAIATPAPSVSALALGQSHSLLLAPIFMGAPTITQMALNGVMPVRSPSFVGLTLRPLPTATLSARPVPFTKLRRI